MSFCIASVLRLLAKNELEGMWKEAAMTLFEILSQNLRWRIEGNREKR
jgi:hypothetical protein